MIRRVFDPAPVNELLNDPAIRPTIGGEGDLDASILMADLRNVCLMSEGGGMLFAWRGPRVFDCHIFCLSRGREALLMAEEMFAIMRPDADLIWGLVAMENRPARWFARQAGMKSLGPMETPDGVQELFEMRF